MADEQSRAEQMQNDGCTREQCVGGESGSCVGFNGAAGIALDNVWDQGGVYTYSYLPWLPGMGYDYLITLTREPDVFSQQTAQESKYRKSRCRHLTCTTPYCKQQ
jgi:hypothetical protein